MASNHVTLKIAKCGDCPNVKRDRQYTEDSWEYCEKWTCKLNGETIAEYVGVYDSDKPKTVPKWCPLRKKSK